MFCKDCGAQLTDDSHFCPHCGSAQTVTPPDEPTPATETPVNFADQVRSAVKKMGTSTGFLIATICLTFVQLFGLLYLNSTGGIWETYSELFAEFGLSNPTASFDNLSLVSGILSMLPGILITLGLWITVCNCASRKAKVSASGLTLIFTVNLVQMVFSCLALLAGLIPLGMLYAGADNLLTEHAEYIEMLLLIVIITLVILFAFVLLYSIKICTTISNIRSTLKTGVPNRKASRFVAIMCYISGGICILSGIVSLLSAGFVSLDGYYDGYVPYSLSSEIFFSAISSLLTAAAQILFGAMIFIYRRKMKDLEAEERILAFQTLSYAEPYTSPVYIPPQPVSAPEANDEPVLEEEIYETKRWDL